MEHPKWMDDPAVAHISTEKLEFLHSLVFESKGLSQKEMFSFLMSVMKKAKEKNIQFKENEMNLLIQTIKKYSSAEEIATIEKMVAAKKKG
ncbi:MAG: hypothetical protein IJN54_04210 [Lachnospiraceae bacterium]|nr:hypothetical protein [Lachnospiraceae bacterium]